MGITDLILDVEEGISFSFCEDKPGSVRLQIRHKIPVGQEKTVGEEETETAVEELETATGTEDLKEEPETEGLAVEPETGSEGLEAELKTEPEAEKLKTESEPEAEELEAEPETELQAEPEIESKADSKNEEAETLYSSVRELKKKMSIDEREDIRRKYLYERLRIREIASLYHATPNAMRKFLRDSMKLKLRDERSEVTERARPLLPNERRALEIAIAEGLSNEQIRQSLAVTDYQIHYCRRTMHG